VTYAFGGELSPLDATEIEAATTHLVNYLMEKRNVVSAQGSLNGEFFVADQPGACGPVVAGSQQPLHCLRERDPAYGIVLNSRIVVLLANWFVSLQQAERYQELVMLYRNRGLHRQALDLLYKHGLVCAKVYVWFVLLKKYLSFAGNETANSRGTTKQSSTCNDSGRHTLT
jgi:hypothetical protein